MRYEKHEALATTQVVDMARFKIEEYPLAGPRD